jgi:hypothetical protein
MNYRKLALLSLIVITIAVVLLTIPTVYNNISDPNLVVYFNHDEGYQMDLIWAYYTGEIRDSYQGELDYGLEMVYLSDIARIILSHFIEFTPGTFVLILRWVHLIAWIGALIALWHLVGNHFGKGWQQVTAVLLLAMRPTYDYVMNSLKPEPLVLLFMIIGLNYLLKIVERPRLKYLLISMSCASIAAIIKFAGVFLLPTAIGALYFGNRYYAALEEKPAAWNFKTKNSWFFPLFIGMAMTALPFCVVFLFRRRSTGLTLFESHGLHGSLTQYKILLLIAVTGILVVLSSLLINYLSRSKNSLFVRVMGIVNDINSYAMIVSGIFFGTLMLFGFRWLTIPRHFFQTYVGNGNDFSGGEVIKKIHTLSDFFHVLLNNIVHKLISFDILLILLLCFYLLVELKYFRRHSSNESKLKFYKRMTLLVYLIPFVLSVINIGRFAPHHMLPFLIAVIILSIQGFIIASDVIGKGWMKTGVLICVVALILIDIALNGRELIQLRIAQMHQREDVAFEVEQWLKENAKYDTHIVADHYAYVYIPQQFKNVKVIRRYDLNRDEVERQMRQLVEKHQPQFIYYNEGPRGMPMDGKPWPALEKIVTDKKIKLVKVFDSAGRRYQRTGGDRFVIYEVFQ